MVATCSHLRFGLEHNVCTITGAWHEALQAPMRPSGASWRTLCKPT